MAEPGIATASGSRHEDPEEPHREPAPDPIEHGTPDVELANAQLSMGRPDLDEPVPDEELTEEAIEAGGSGGRLGRGQRRGGGGGGSGGGRGSGGDAGGELAPASASHVAGRAGLVSRLVHFLQGSWRELQRVQWPDRRQVMQATGVVIGFVIVAGVFLGLADLVANKVVQLILK
ncbi:MAG TPA: preprotein translocase subunit SecE [Solirubrobacteraceae bacterium]|nr:preprotein translocase subunit SecE [Solirubrobacteraceae bacterium]